jgi:rhamnosyltransferase subunit B
MRVDRSASNGDDPGMQVLLLALGSHGDVHPFVGVARRLRERGHQVTIAANEHFKPLIDRSGFAFEPLGTAEEYKRLASNPDLWHRRKALRVVWENGVVASLRPAYELTMGFASRPDAVVAGSSLAVGMLMAEEKLGKPMALVHLSPAIVRSDFDTPVLPGSPARPWMPRWLKRGITWLGDVAVIDPLMKPGIDSFRREIGLPPLCRHVFEWWSEAGRIIGFWPEWFAKPQPDWPPQMRLAGFPLYDEKDLAPMGDEVKSFLAAGEAPVAFTAGSAMWSEHPFFAESARACEMLGVRGILLTRYREHVPASLPKNVIHVAYAPFSELLPRCAALVHHGGIGTTAQALAAGIPQLIMPLAHDQPDNAARVKRLGVGLEVSPQKYRARRVSSILEELTREGEIRVRCSEVRRWFNGQNGAEAACGLIEAMRER